MTEAETLKEATQAYRFETGKTKAEPSPTELIRWLLDRVREQDQEIVALKDNQMLDGWDYE